MGTTEIHVDIVPRSERREPSLELPICDRQRLAQELGKGAFIECNFETEDLFRLPHIDKAELKLQMDSAHKLLAKMKQNGDSDTFVVQGLSSEEAPFRYLVTVIDDMLAIEGQHSSQLPLAGIVPPPGVEWLSTDPSNTQSTILTPHPLTPHPLGKTEVGSSTPEAFVRNPALVLDFLRNVTDPSVLKIEPRRY